MCGCLGWSASPKSKKFKFIWFFVLMIGVIFSSLNIKSVEVIKFAQVANGILLPLVAVFLIWIANKKELLAGYTNNLFQNFINQSKNLDTLVTTQKKFLTSMGILQRAEIVSKDIAFSKKTDLFYRIRRLIDEKQMGELFKVMLIKTKNNKIQTGFQND